MGNGFNDTRTDGNHSASKKGKKLEKYDVVVCGGGLAGFCAAVASARHGAKTCLVQDRPVFGGNSSSEVRVTPHGAAAFHVYAKETGIISELLIEERARNHEPIFENGWTNSVWDMTMYDLAQRTDNLTFYLNTTILDVRMAYERKIASVVGYVANTEMEIELEADVFVDCTGDGIVADRAGCEWRMGSEASEEFDEPHAPLQASGDVMGSSLLFKTKDLGYPAPFTAPDWAAKLDNPDFFYKQGRNPNDMRGGYWWIEIGMPWHTINENEDIRHELTRYVLGIWDWIKNKDPLTKELAANHAIDWIGQVPGKRESRRIMGHYLMTEHDPLNRTVFEDEIAYGGWFLDLHTPGGLLAPTSEHASSEGYDETSPYMVKSYCGPYGIPLRSAIAKDVDNLMMAGRNISVTHAALGTVRVMATTALVGQAVGTSAAIALKHGISLADVPSQAIREVKQTLLRDGCFLPNATNEDELDLARTARVTASSQASCSGSEVKAELQASGELGHQDEILRQRKGQWIAISEDVLHRVSVCVTNLSDTPQIVEAKMIPVDHIWDYRCDANPPLAATELEIMPGNYQWIDWDVQLSGDDGLKPGTYVRLDLLANPHVAWHCGNGIVPGQTCAYEMGEGKMRRDWNGPTRSFRVDPPQRAYSPEHVISGVTRPYRFTNLWRSDAKEALPQWLELKWEEQQSIGQIEITFPGSLLWEYRGYSPFYRDPQCPKDYRIEAYVDGRWQELLQVKDNYQRHCRHTLTQSVQTDTLRVVIEATNGDPSAGIYEIRCYQG
ncbi:FAD-dependent oxidoreductase [Paenibacillus methanolicus]|uniref:FAD dependent oxidoreductase n=1 Tax=Paenibacillus methanolicus TaxID=582686 RepID=A0A5S5CFF6_9BACL|nr:FAD-dependent oxidoreductase [Paenibacillus methanolicus]TYP76733.1 FAD dependent oxidoreductase [Paenibacillus methanolicus]